MGDDLKIYFRPVVKGFPEMGEPVVFFTQVKTKRKPYYNLLIMSQI